MKTLPVTPELIVILESALSDSYDFINECEPELDHYEGNARKTIVAGIERRRQHIAIIRDLLDRYS
jgi:hypothetical protein